jgi:hypothetical protein
MASRVQQSFRTARFESRKIIDDGGRSRCPDLHSRGHRVVAIVSVMGNPMSLMLIRFRGLHEARLNHLNSDLTYLDALAEKVRSQFLSLRQSSGRLVESSGLQYRKRP